MAAFRSTVDSAIRGPVTRCMDMHGSGQVPGMAPAESLGGFLELLLTIAERG